MTRAHHLALIVAAAVGPAVALYAAAGPATSHGAALATQAPQADTEVYVTPLPAAGTTVAADALVNASRSPGYDNQPSFLPDGSGVLYTSNRDGQTDIYRFDFASGAATAVTHTPESEYSPIVTPDLRTFSVIRVEADGTQRLWRFDLDGSNPRLVLADVKPVGYHVWVDATHLALFVLGSGREPATLQYADTATGTARVIATGIGRSLHRRPGGGTVSFISKPAGAHWTVSEFDPATGAVRALVDTADDNRGEDVAWTPDGRLLMSRGAMIVQWRPGSTAGWEPFADFSAAGIDRISRIAVQSASGIAGGAPAGRSPDAPRLALVAEPRAR
ncbi:MAG: hypothetical protein R2752_08785 [Vicinamibacterales bacterium]